MRLETQTCPHCKAGTADKIEETELLNRCLSWVADDECDYGDDEDRGDGEPITDELGRVYVHCDACFEWWWTFLLDDETRERAPVDSCETDAAALRAVVQHPGFFRVENILTAEPGPRFQIGLDLGPAGWGSRPGGFAHTGRVVWFEANDVWKAARAAMEKAHARRWACIGCDGTGRNTDPKPGTETCPACAGACIVEAMP